MRGKFNLNRGFGIELELIRPNGISKDRIIEEINDTGEATANYPNGASDRQRRFWKMTTDCSVRSSKRGHTGDNELVSPILRGHDGVNQLKTVLEVLNRLNCSVNVSCGTHVHHDVTDAVGGTSKDARRFLDNLVTWTMKFEHIIYKLVSPSRLKTGYSVPARLQLNPDMDAPMFTNYNWQNFKSSYKTKIRTAQRRRSHYEIQKNRYSGLNLQNIWSRGSVEFRYHNGTLDFDKLMSWIIVTQSIVNVCEMKKHVRMSTVKSGSKGLAQFRKALGFNDSDRDSLTKDANKYTIKRFRELSNREADYRHAQYYRFVNQGI